MTANISVLRLYFCCVWITNWSALSASWRQVLAAKFLHSLIINSCVQGNCQRDIVIKMNGLLPPPPQTSARKSETKIWMRVFDLDKEIVSWLLPLPQDGSECGLSSPGVRGGDGFKDTRGKGDAWTWTERSSVFKGATWKSVMTARKSHLCAELRGLSHRFVRKKKLTWQ